VRGNGDDLIEEYSGYWFRVENREVGTRRLGVSLEVSRFTQKWDPATLSALESNPNLADLYRRRLTVQPAVTVAFSPHVRLTAGASVSELRPLSEASGSQMASAFVAAVGYDQTWKPTPDASHHAAASYQIRAGTAALDSDLIYRRHFGQARYRFEQGRSSITADLLLGRLTGRAPMFERFSLGDTSTLRGWNKFDIVPAGADRLVHQSVEYRYRSFAYFVDLGSVWTAGTDARLRLATGIGFHSDHAFVTFGFPLNADAAGAMFMLGVRLGARF
jgi:outer membrane translocation and assembly module TamA